FPIMTFIHSQKNRSSLTRMIVLLMVALFTGTGGLILLYNKVVDLNHEISQAKAQLEAVGAQNTQFNNRIIAIIGGGDLTAVANERGLVLDNAPQYFTAAAAVAPSLKAPIAAK